ncbi:MAG: hypothetical protein KAU20_07765 [Nanoarchaeota archaeon]|nr:hypothetical protein [Nanoarchaeota archaeon]
MTDNFKKEIGKTPKQGIEIEKIASVIKRCPKCHNLSLEFDKENNRIICKRCGFSQDLMR